MALTNSQQIPIGEKAQDFALHGIDERAYTLESFDDKKILVIVFMCNHCPYVQACWDRLIALQNEFGPRGVQFVGINSNDEAQYPDDSFAMMKEFAKQKGHNFPYLRDETQQVARAYGAVCTPDIFVYDEVRHLAYHGRIDDNWSDVKSDSDPRRRVGASEQEPAKVKKRELAEALDALLQGKKPSREQKPSMGCSIKWK